MTLDSTDQTQVGNHISQFALAVAGRLVEESSGEPLACCGVCQYEGRHCAAMAPTGAMEAHLPGYAAAGFDFAGFSPAELWARLKGEERHH